MNKGTFTFKKIYDSLIYKNTITKDVDFLKICFRTLFF